VKPIFLERLRIPLGSASLCLREEVCKGEGESAEEFDVLGFPITGTMAVSSTRRMDALKPSDRPPFSYDATAPERGMHTLRIFEHRDYYWSLEGGATESITITSSLDRSIDSSNWKSQGSHGRFRFVNYLGSAWIEVGGMVDPPIRIHFDVASPKLDYEQEYRAMVEAIGEECQQLLLDWGTSSSMNIVGSHEQEAQSLLEKFLFLRHVLGTEKLDLFLETISKSPHSKLEREMSWKPAAVADQSLFASDPFGMGRNWVPKGSVALPSDICEVRRYDSVDTPPNRFVKFALKSFHYLCEEILALRKGDKTVFPTSSVIGMEATSMLDSLDALLSESFFSDVGELQRIPFESTALQRREGYRDILLAWLMLDAAAQLEWPGRDDAYDGTSRNVATLYEYWIYFALVRAFGSVLGMESIDDPLANKGDDELPFCCEADDGKLRINLRQKEASFSSFRWKGSDGKLMVHFFYNRSFGRKGIHQRGSYSKTFRPDYTLVIIPAEYDSDDWRKAERDAEAAGRIAYLHFDAKYRGENLPSILGDDVADDDGDTAATTAKNPDLYKMHTYNEAIRRTIGSYVIYPGTEKSEKKGSRFERYHELIPGIGAFALRPSSAEPLPIGIKSICEFIEDILSHQLNKFTQSYLITSVTEEVIREVPVSILDREVISRPKAPVILGNMKKEAVEVFRCGTAQNGMTPFFYCHATDDDNRPLSIDIAAATGGFLTGWNGSYGGPFISVNWMAKIISCRLVTAETILNETGRTPSKPDRLYLFFSLEDVSPLIPRDISNLVRKSNGAGQGGIYRTFQVEMGSLLKQPSKF